MKTLISILSLIGLTACGGVAIPGISGPAVSGGSTPVQSISLINQNPPSTYGIASLAPDPVSDASFGSILNTLRIGNGADAVTYDARLDAAAQGHADDMVNRGFFSHVNPDGETEFDRIVAAGYNPVNWGENIAGRQQSEAEALVSWIESPEHNRLLNAGTVEDFGLGVAGSGLSQRWVLVMAKERN